MEGRNTSQDPEYEGPVYHEKKFHKTHFGVKKTWQGKHPKDDPDWEYIGVGRWRRISEKQDNPARQREVQRAVPKQETEGVPTD